MGSLGNGVAIAVSAGATNIKLRDRFGPRPLLVIGALLGAAGLALLAQLTPTSSYVAGVLPGLVVMGLGLGMVMGGSISTATYRVEPEDAGVASAMVSTMQQIGGAIGTALLSTIFASAVTAYASSRVRTPQVLAAATVHGYSVAFYVSAAILAGGAVVLGVLVPSINTKAGPSTAATTPDPVGVGA